MKMKYYGHGNRKMKIKGLRFKKHLPRTPLGSIGVAGGPFLCRDMPIYFCLYKKKINKRIVHYKKIFIALF